MTTHTTIKLTASFERNLAAIAAFLATEAQESIGTYKTLLIELLDIVIPNLERFPTMGSLFLARPVRSVEVLNASDVLRSRCQSEEVREYELQDCMMLYIQIDSIIYLLSIKHHRQLSFDFESLWHSAPQQAAV